MKSFKLFAIALCGVVVIAGVEAEGAAAGPGVTAFTCKGVPFPGALGTKGFGDEHCKNPKENTAGHLEEVKYEHVSFGNDQTTELRITNAKTFIGETEETENFVLGVTVAGTEIVLQATGVEAVGPKAWHNHLVGTEHQTTGDFKLKFTGVTVVKPEGCTVREAEGGTVGQFTSNELLASSAGLEGVVLKFQPTEGTAIAGYFIEGASCPVIVKGKKEIFGSFTSSGTSGATITMAHADVTTQGTLRYGAATGPKAGLAGVFTISGRANNTEGWRPLTFTTATS